MIKIDIPNARPPELDPELLAVATHVLANAFREAGVPLRKAAGSPMILGFVREWVFGRITRTEFIHRLRIIKILCRW